MPNHKRHSRSRSLSHHAEHKAKSNLTHSPPLTPQPHVPLPHTQWLDHYADPSAPTKPIPKPFPSLKPFSTKWKSANPNLKTRAGILAKFGSSSESSSQNYYGGYPGMMGGGMGMGMYPGMMGMGGMGGMGMYPGMMGGYGVSPEVLTSWGAMLN